MRPPFDPSLETYRRERAWLDGEVAAAASLTDADRVAILRDLLETVECIRRTKTPEDLEREEAARRTLDSEGLARYCALIERLERR